MSKITIYQIKTYVGHTILTNLAVSECEFNNALADAKASVEGGYANARCVYEDKSDSPFGEIETHSFLFGAAQEAYITFIKRTF